MTQLETQCRSCRHYRGERGYTHCAAFPEGIPLEVLFNQHDHRTAYPGDNGVRWQIDPRAYLENGIRNPFVEKERQRIAKAPAGYRHARPGEQPDWVGPRGGSYVRVGNRKRTSLQPLSEDATKWLDEWVYGNAAQAGMPPPDVYMELRRYRPIVPIRVYRGIAPRMEANESKKPWRSFTYSRDLAETIAGYGEYADEPDIPKGRVEEMVVDPNDILVDFTLLPNATDYINEVLVMRPNFRNAMENAVREVSDTSNGRPQGSGQSPETVETSGVSTQGSEPWDLPPPKGANDLDRYIAALNEHPRIRAQEADYAKTAEGDDSTALWTAGGEWHPERAALHEQIKNDMLNPKAKDRPEGAKPRAIIMIGPPASGKTTARRSWMRKLGGEWTQIDADYAKERLPEFEERGAAWLHDESKVIANDVMHRAIADRHDLTYDTLGSDPDRLGRLSAKLKDNGYEVHLVKVELPAHKRVGRAVNRLREEGRWVPIPVLLGRDDAIQGSWEALRGKVDGWVRLDTDVPRGEDPRQVERGDAFKPGPAYKGAG